MAGDDEDNKPQEEQKGAAGEQNKGLNKLAAQVCVSLSPTSLSCRLFVTHSSLHRTNAGLHHVLIPASLDLPHAPGKSTKNRIGRLPIPQEERELDHAKLVKALEMLQQNMKSSREAAAAR